MTVVVLLLFGIGLSEDSDPGAMDARSSAERSTPTAPTSEQAQPSSERASDEAVDPQPTRTPGEKATVQPPKSAEPKPEPPPAPAPRPRARTFLVTYVVDGDTIELANGERVRVVGIDTPERGECGYDSATALMARLVLGKRVRLTVSDEDRDRYGRLLRYVDVGRKDAGLRMIDSGLAIARYDSRDGYGYHPRENRYIAADTASPDRTCPKPKPFAPVQPAGGRCEPGYAPCVPPYPPDVDCADVDGPIRVTGPDPHGLDGDGDGVACE